MYLNSPMPPRARDLGLISPAPRPGTWVSSTPIVYRPPTPPPIVASTLPGVKSVPIPPVVPTGTATPTTVAANPVPSSWPTTSTYIDGAGNVWAYSGSAWVNYGTSANAANQAALVANAEAQAMAASGASTVSPAPVTVTTNTGSTYQEILDWLSATDLLAGLGISNIPNWIPALGAGLLLARAFSNQPKGRR